MTCNLHLDFLATGGTVSSFVIHRRPGKDDGKIARGENLIGCKLPVKARCAPHLGNNGS